MDTDKGDGTGFEDMVSVGFLNIAAFSEAPE